MSKFILSAFADEIDSDLTTQMDVLDKYSIKHIEMRGVNGKNLVEHTLHEVAEIKKQLDKRGFSISAIGSPIGKIQITESFEPHLELFNHTLKIAEILEAKYIRIFSFFIPEGESPCMYRNEVMDRMKKLAQAADRKGITLLHENEKDIYGDTPKRCLDIINTVNCNYLKATFDPANFVQCNVKTYPEAYEILKEHIEYLHIKDAVYSDHHVVPAGEGDGKVREIIKALHDRKFEGFLSLEPHLSNFTGFQALEQNNAEPLNLTCDGEGKFEITFKALNKILQVISGGGHNI